MGLLGGPVPHPAPRSGTRRPEGTTGGRTTTSADKAQALRAACNDFEAIFIAQLLTSGQGDKEEGILGGDVADEVMRAQFNDALARTMAKRGALGIGEAVYRELSR